MEHTFTKKARRNTYINKLIALTASILMLTLLGTMAAYANNDEDNADYAPVTREFATTANLNFRSGPCTSYPRHMLLMAGTVINVYEYVEDGFSPASFNGLTGYVSSEFIRPHVRSVSNQTQTIERVEINGDVELLHWREVRQLIPANSTLQVTDVGTGNVFFVRNWSNGNHADVDPITYADTQTLRASFGGRWSWDPRPVIVTFNGRNFAAAINGMPHGGSVTPGNGVNGHFCLHFYGSTTHNGNRNYERDMQAAVRRAFNSAN